MSRPGLKIRRGRHGWVRVRIRTTGVHRATTRLALCRGPPYFVGERVKATRTRTSTRATCSTRRPHIYHVGGIDNGQQSAYVSLGEIFLLYTKYSGRSFADVSSNGSRVAMVAARVRRQPRRRHRQTWARLPPQRRARSCSPNRCLDGVKGSAGSSRTENHAGAISIKKRVSKFGLTPLTGNGVGKQCASARLSGALCGDQYTSQWRSVHVSVETITHDSMSSTGYPISECPIA